jgi:hypothetical protein
MKNDDRVYDLSPSLFLCRASKVSTKTAIKKNEYETPFRMRGNPIILLPTKTLIFRAKASVLKTYNR